MSSCVCKISFKSVQVCGGCCKMFRGLTFLGHSVQTVAVERVDGLCVEKRPLHLLPDHFQIERVIRQYRVARSCCELLHKVAQHHVTPLSVTRCSLITSPRLERRSIVTTVSVCLSVCMSASVSPELHVPSSPNFYACYICPCLGPRRDTLCTSGSMDDVIFAHNWPYARVPV